MSTVCITLLEIELAFSHNNEALFLGHIMADRERITLDRNKENGFVRGPNSTPNIPIGLLKIRQ